MARVAQYVVTEHPGGFEIGVGDDVFACPPGTVVYGSWIPDAGMGATRLVHLNRLAPAGSVEADQVPEKPHGAFRRWLDEHNVWQQDEEPVDLGTDAPRIDPGTNGSDGAVNASLQDAHERIATLEAQLAALSAPATGVTVAARPVDENSPPADQPLFVDPSEAARTGDASTSAGGDGADAGNGAHTPAGVPPAATE